MDRFVLLVEGPDDSHTLYHLLKRYEIEVAKRGEAKAQEVVIESAGGVTQLLQRLPVEIKIRSTADETSRIGIIIDADADSSSESVAEPIASFGVTTSDGLVRRWQSLRNILIDSGYSGVPLTPDSEGTVVDSPDGYMPRVGVWLMPDNQIPGKLENFVKMLVPVGDTLWERADFCVTQLPQSARRFSAHDEVKALIHTWLAWQAEPGKPIGQAITKRFLDPDAPLAQRCVSWVKRLFDL